MRNMYLLNSVLLYGCQRDSLLLFDGQDRYLQEIFQGPRNLLCVVELPPTSNLRSLKMRFPKVAKKLRFFSTFCAHPRLFVCFHDLTPVDAVDYRMAFGPCLQAARRVTAARRAPETERTVCLRD